MNRRQFLKLSAAISAGLVRPTMLQNLGFRRAYAEAVGVNERFVDPLVKPPYLHEMPGAEIGKIKGATAYKVYATQNMHAFSVATYPEEHPLAGDLINPLLNNVPGWAYSPYPVGNYFVEAAKFHYLGPTIEAYREEKVSLEVVNQLGDHMFTVDHDIHGPDQYSGQAARIITHLHGGVVSPDDDGYPDHYYMAPDSRIHNYPNKQRAANIWYHDHSLGATRLNVAAGLAALYFIRDDFEMSLGLPSGEYEQPLVIQDRTFTGSGQLLYPNQWQEEYFAEAIIVNGRIWPFKEVEPRKYRLRLLNGSNARTYRVWLEDENGATLPWTQIGNSGGFLPNAIVNAGQITMAPAERADIIVDFSAAALAGKTITMKNDAGAPFFHKGTTLDYIAGLPDEDPVNTYLRDIMQFKVTLPLADADNSASPAGAILALDPIPANAPTDTRDFVFEVQEEPYDWWAGYTGPTDIPKGLRLVIHSMQLGWYQDYLTDVETLGQENADWRIYSTGFMWNDVPDKVQRGAKCQWTFWNITGDMHPLHVHLVNFEVIQRQVLAGNGKLPVLDGTPGFPGAADDLGFSPPYIVSLTGIDANETGTRDTVKMYPGHATTIRFQAREFVGKYPFHCHIIDHEDHEMMRQYEIVTGTGDQPGKGKPKG